MAISRGAGTEIIRTHLFEDVAASVQKLIIGEKHHIYTVLSVICHCNARSGSENGMLRLYGYDALGGTTASIHKIFVCPTPVNETYVWNDKFSFNGYEPTDFTGPMDDTTKQNAIADQGSSVAQYLSFQTDSASTEYDIIITFIDQNNA